MTTTTTPLSQRLKACVLPVVASANVPQYSMLICLTVFGTVVCFLTTSLWSRTLALAYGAYCVLDTASPQASTKSKWIRRHQHFFGSLWFVRWTAEYFDTQLIKTTELDPSNSYIFNYHPHGVIGMGASLALSTDGCQFTKVFPGIERSCVTLNVAFWVPLYRHWMLWLGCCSANRPTLQARLSNNNDDSNNNNNNNSHESLVLLPGGAAEALHAHPGLFKLLIKNRRGFIQLARETKAFLVPVIGFGENDLFETVYTTHHHHAATTTTTTTDGDGDGTTGSGSGDSSIHGKLSSSSLDTKGGMNNCTVPSSSSCSWIGTIQHRLYKYCTFSTPMWFHLLPKQVPLRVVVGAPVRFPQDTSLDECHAIYLDAVTTLFDQHKSNYGYDHVVLEFI